LSTPEGRLLISVYIYPAPPAAAAAAREQACRDEFDSVNQSIAENHEDARPVEQGDAALVDQVPASLSHRSIFRYAGYFDDHVQTVGSEAHLYCYVGGNWFVKYRVTSPEAVTMRGPVETFIRTRPWPGRGASELTVMTGPGLPGRSR
jgi:hypothetical protein